MNRISGFSVSKSLLRRNPFTRSSAKPVSSSLNSINPTSSNLITQAAGECNADYLKKEISKVHSAVIDAWMNIELGTLPPLDASKILADQFNAFMEKFGLENGDRQHHLLRYGEEIAEEIEMLEDSFDRAVTYGKYADAGGRLGYHFKDWYNGRFEGESSELEKECDTLPTTQEHIAMHVDDASAVVAENLDDITYQVSSFAILTTLFLSLPVHFCFIFH
ncbi:hypothetical protein MKW98_007016 [Papaver atlanticum]|uniref:Uncharacterized protein n=1 Tax=Papaver atlanticum TaxID=357466 RepID=A0AAD4STB5_9MAGN|nr:hypothetical protein MKW98_007016 [Papaver atlanticum]